MHILYQDSTQFSFGFVHVTWALMYLFENFSDWRLPRYSLLKSQMEFQLFAEDSDETSSSLWHSSNFLISFCLEHGHLSSMNWKTHPSTSFERATADWTIRNFFHFSFKSVSWSVGPCHWIDLYSHSNDERMRWFRIKSLTHRTTTAIPSADFQFKN